jgi:hypothetical protein
MTALNNKTQTYSLLVSGERFELTKDQIQSDSGNYFATFFFGDFAEADNGCTELIISKEPKLFKLIQAHLRGYTILPLSASSIPDYMTPETTAINLLAEAQYYGLQMLFEKIKQFRIDQQRIEDSLGTAVRMTPKTYKLAVSVPKMCTRKMTQNSKENSGGIYASWKYCDITESGFNALLQRFHSSSTYLAICPPAPGIQITGYKLVVCWREVHLRDPLGPSGLPPSNTCALLESSS